uniref:Uncharacterized protein n=1 Tax=Oryza sativa subsp. japonica TaxID=39947 RepID=Q6Z6R3_ORYSJ|nr:hypothetical protein [Oryza sativa Japonica Group]
MAPILMPPPPRSATTTVQSVASAARSGDAASIHHLRCSIRHCRLNLAPGSGEGRGSAAREGRCEERGGAGRDWEGRGGDFYVMAYWHHKNNLPSIYLVKLIYQNTKLLNC